MSSLYNIRSIVSTIILPFKQENTVQILCFSRGRLNKRKPIYKGRIEFLFKHDSLWRPRRILWEEQGKWKAYPPKNTIQEIFVQSSIIILDKNLTSREKEGIKNYCHDFAIKTKLIEGELCPFCLIHEEITWLSASDNYLAYNRIICKSCAISELEKELKAKKVDLLASPGFKRYALNLLNRFQDSNVVAEFLTKGDSDLSEITMVNQIHQMSVTERNKTLQPVSKFELPLIISQSLKLRNINFFLPIQVLALKKGLLQGKSLLVIANTSAGKTLIAEIAGINHVMSLKKMIYIVPLVALANTKFEDFKNYYGSQVKVGLRIGKSRIFDSEEERKEFYANRYSIKDSDIIIATYEGLDLLLRAGDIDFDQIGCIIIDEIQSLADPDRGPTLDCLIAKIRTYTKKAQILCLSATIGNPIELAQDLSLDLVTYDQRPVSLEQHVLISRSFQDKLRQIYNLIKNETQFVSSTGFRGQTIIFTNSRRKTAEITDYLQECGIREARAYHSGLSYKLRKRIEQAFTKGECPAIVSTYALGAGVDFPASQVIFESLMMGNKLLDPNTFTQMHGRAGRLGKHDRGRAVLLCLGESVSSLDARSEIEIAFELLKAELISITPNYDENSCGEQILSICSSKPQISPKEAYRIYNKMIGTKNFNFRHVTNSLIQNSLIKIKTHNKLRYLNLTSLGRAAVLSFFSPLKVISIKKHIQRQEHFLSIALESNPPQNVYISRKLHTYLEKTYHMRFSTRLINSPVLDVMTSSLQGKEGTELNKWCLTLFSKWTQQIFNCKCRENPYCDHGSQRIGKLILDERLAGKGINQISATMSRYELLLYPGDILSFLNNLIHELEGIERIAQALKNLKLAKTITIMINKIEIPPN